MTGGFWQRAQPTFFFFLGFLSLSLVSTFCLADEEKGSTASNDITVSDPKLILKASEPLSDDYFPCSDCHGGEITNFKRRKLVDEHDTLEFRHGDRWCLDCHYSENRDVLHLVDGSNIEYKESWKLCVQCHGNKLTAWRVGIHGKRTGHWNGIKYYETCVTCHDPHVPTVTPLKPEPRPPRPEEIHMQLMGDSKKAQ